MTTTTTTTTATTATKQTTTTMTLEPSQRSPKRTKAKDSITISPLVPLLVILSSIHSPIAIIRAQQTALQSFPGPALGFEQLARSPASSQLLAQFIASEQRSNFRGAPATAPVLVPQRGATLTQQQLQAAATAPDAIASARPVYSATLAGAFRLDQYHRLEEIYAFVDALARQYPSRVRVFTIGRTAERRPIKAIELVNNATDLDFVWLDALTHAREWITGTTLLYTIDRIVAGASARQDGSLNSVAFAKNYIIVPVVNPDGYAYTWTTNRMWRKNRSRSAAAGKQCFGADLNRNFDHFFGGEGSSADPCSHIYSGPEPFSEPETRAVAEMLWSLRERIKFYLTMHSFNQLWACPYAHTVERTPHYPAHMRVLAQIRRAVLDSDGVEYEIGPLSTSLYVGSGFGVDFAYDKCGIVHSYLVELRDKGANGFILPPDQIMPTARETWAGLKAGLRAALQ